MPGRLLKLELERVAANTSRLMGRRVAAPRIDATALHGGEAHVAALLCWVQARLISELACAEVLPFSALLAHMPPVLCIECIIYAPLC